MIADGGTLDFGSVTPNLPVDRQVTVLNVGGKALALSPLSAGSFPIGFSLISNIGTTNLAPGASTSFTVRFQASAVGIYGGIISFGNDDPDESPFDLKLAATVSAARVIDNGDPGFSTVGTWLVAPERRLPGGHPLQRQGGWQ